MVFKHIQMKGLYFYYILWLSVLKLRQAQGIVKLKSDFSDPFYHKFYIHFRKKKLYHKYFTPTHLYTVT